MGQTGTGTRRGAAAGPDTPADPASARRVAWEIAVRRIEARDRTRAELARTLHEKGTAPDVAEEVLGRLTELRLVDDHRVAKVWAESKRRTSGMTGPALRAGLVRRGVAAEVVAEAVVGVDPDEEQARALELARERVRRMSALPADTVMRRVGGQLARRGYDPSTAYRAVRTALAERGAAPGNVDGTAVDGTDVDGGTPDTALRSGPGD